MTYNSFLNDCYARYKADWCHQRGVTVAEVNELLGVNGECYVCLEEFEAGEFRDADYMYSLMGPEGYEKWRHHSGALPEKGESAIQVMFNGTHMDTVYVPESEVDATIASIARCGFDNYNQDVKEDYYRLGGVGKPILTFAVVRVAQPSLERETSHEKVADDLVQLLPRLAAAVNAPLLSEAVAFFEDRFDVDRNNERCCCGSLQKLHWILGRDYRHSGLMFDVVAAFEKEYDPEVWTPAACWDFAIKQCVGESAFEAAFDESGTLTQHRIVQTCFESDTDTNDCYADFSSRSFFDLNAAHEYAAKMAQDECEELAEYAGDGIFEVDDSANNDYEVRWYEKKPEARTEGECGIEYVTTYNVYPVVYNEAANWYEYRGFIIIQAEDRVDVTHNGQFLGSQRHVWDGLGLVDDICLACSKDKTCALEAVHKVPLDLIIQYARADENKTARNDREVSKDTELVR